jgi:hypothetical protein
MHEIIILQNVLIWYVHICITSNITNCQEYPEELVIIIVTNLPIPSLPLMKRYGVFGMAEG